MCRIHLELLLIILGLFKGSSVYQHFKRLSDIAIYAIIKLQIDNFFFLPHESDAGIDENDNRTRSCVANKLSAWFFDLSFRFVFEFNCLMWILKAYLNLCSIIGWNSYGKWSIRKNSWESEKWDTNISPSMFGIQTKHFVDLKYYAYMALNDGFVKKLPIQLSLKLETKHLLKLQFNWINVVKVN